MSGKSCATIATPASAGTETSTSPSGASAFTAEIGVAASPTTMQAARCRKWFAADKGLDLEQDDGDVVATTGVERQIDQLVERLEAVLR